MARGPSCGARSAQRHVNIAQPARPVLTRSHRVEHLADGAVIRMSSRTEAQARPAPHGLLNPLDRCPDLRTVCHLRDRIEGRAYALKPVSHGLPDSPACFGQDVGELCVPVVAHGRILPLAKTLSQATFTQPRYSSGTLCRQVTQLRAVTAAPE